MLRQFFFFPSPWGGFQTSAEPNLSPPSNWGQIADVLSVGGQGASSDSRPPFLQIISFSGRIKLSPGGAGTVQGDRGQLSLRRGTLPTPHPLEKERESEREGGEKTPFKHFGKSGGRVFPESSSDRRFSPSDSSGGPPKPLPPFAPH